MSEWMIGLGAGMQTFGNGMQALGEQKRADAAKRSLEEAEKAREAGRKLFVQKGNPSEFAPWVSDAAKGYMSPTGSADSLKAERFNKFGESLGIAEPRVSELADWSAQQEAAKGAAAANQAKSAIAAAKENRYQESHQSKLKIDEARLKDYARKDAKAKNIAQPDEGKLWAGISNRLADPSYREAVESGDPLVLNQLQPRDQIDGILRRVGDALGVEVKESAEKNLIRELEQEHDPVVRAKMIENFAKEMDVAAARGRADGKGQRPPRT